MRVWVVDFHATSGSNSNYQRNNICIRKWLCPSHLMGACFWSSTCLACKPPIYWGGWARFCQCIVTCRCSMWTMGKHCKKNDGSSVNRAVHTHMNRLVIWLNGARRRYCILPRCSQRCFKVMLHTTMGSFHGNRKPCPKEKTAEHGLATDFRLPNFFPGGKPSTTFVKGHGRKDTRNCQLNTHPWAKRVYGLAWPVHER